MRDEINLCPPYRQSKYHDVDMKDETLKKQKLNGHGQKGRKAMNGEPTSYCSGVVTMTPTCTGFELIHLALRTWKNNCLGSLHGIM